MSTELQLRGAVVLRDLAGELVEDCERALLVVDLGDDRHLRDREARAKVEGRLGREEREDVLVQRDADLGLGAADVALDPGRDLREEVAQRPELALEVARARVEEGAGGHLVRQLGGELVREEVAGRGARRALEWIPSSCGSSESASDGASAPKSPASGVEPSAEPATKTCAMPSSATSPLTF